MVNPVSVHVAIISQYIPGRAVELVEAIFFKISEVDLNGIPETLIFDVTIRISLKHVYDVLLNRGSIGILKIDAVGKEGF